MAWFNSKLVEGVSWKPAGQGRQRRCPMGNQRQISGSRRNRVTGTLKLGGLLKVKALFSYPFIDGFPTDGST